MECILIILIVIFLIVIFVGIVYLKYVEREEMNKLEQKMIYKQKLIENILNEYQEQKHKVSRLEYDILESIVKTIGSGFYFFECDSLPMSLLEKGYFDGATGETDVKEYFKNCEVVKHNETMKEREHLEKDKDV